MADLSQRRYCPRCNLTTTWDTPGVGEETALVCTNWPVGEPEHCGFTLATELSDAEWANVEAHERRENPPAARTNYSWV